MDDFRSTIEQSIADAPHEVLQNISTYLKRFALQKLPKDDVKLTYGKQWVAYMDSKTKHKYIMDSKINLLIHSHAPRVVSASDLGEVMRVSERWMRDML